MTSIIVGSEGPDDLIGSDDVLVAEQIFGLRGSDTIRGNGGQDSLFGGQDSDFLVGGSSDEWLFGGRGGDRLESGDGADIIFGDIGNDNIEGGRGPDVIFGNTGQDIMAGEDGPDTLYGGEGNDSLIGGIRVIRGGGGGDRGDWLFGDAGNDTLVGGGGSDQFVLAAGAGTDLIVDYNRQGFDTILLQGGLTEDELDFVNASENLAGSISLTDLQIIVRSTGEVLAIIRDITAAGFEPIKRIEPLII